MLARGALCRLAADGPKTCPHDLPQLARVLGRTLLARNATAYPAIRALSRAYTSALYSRRSYATTARATKPTATVKKAVKKAAAKKAAPKKKAAPAKKATSAKKPAQKTAAKKPAAKKKAVKKPAARKRVKKELTAEDRRKAKIRELRGKALKEPVSNNATSALNAYVAEACQTKGATMQVIRGTLADAARKFKDLTPAEHEHYNHLANERTAEKRAQYQAWINTHTPEQIKAANNARAQLRRLRADSQKRVPAHTARLHDERQAKGAASGYNIFVRERHATGDFKGIRPTEAIRLIGKEYNALSDAEKKKYQDDSKAAAT